MQQQIEQQLVEAQKKIASLETQIEASRKQIDDLEHRIHLYRTVFQLAPFGISVTDIDGNFSDANPAFCNKLGYTLDELVGKNFIDFTHPNDIMEDLAMSEEIHSKNKSHATIEKRYISKDNQVIWANVTAIVPPNTNGQAIFGVGILEDISTQKQIEHVLEITDYQFQTIFETAPIGMAMIDSSGNFRKANYAFQEIFGYSEDELYQMNSTDLLKTSYVDKTARITREVLRGATILHTERRYQRKDASVIWCNSTTFDVRDENNQLQYIMYLVMDITERKLIEDQQKQAYQTLEQHVEIRTHEIERRRRVADGLRDIVALLNSNKPLEVILNEMVAQGLELLHVRAIAICSIDTPSQITPRAVQQITYDEVAMVNQHLMSSELYQKLLRFELITLGDLTFMDDSVYVIPMKIEGTVDGCVQLYYMHPDDLTTEEKAIALTYTDQIALAIINLTLREQIKQAAAIEERNRLARDLHDAVSQTLWSASLIAEILPDVWQQDISKGYEKLQQLRQLNQVALAEMRSLLLEIRPQALENTPIEETLPALITSIQNRANIHIDYTITSHPTNPTSIKVTFYRVAQEALNNIVKHAHATQVNLQYLGTANQVQLTIQDNGVGFDLDTVSAENFGLKIMHERAEDINASFTIMSNKNQGTTIKLIWVRDGGDNE